MSGVFSPCSAKGNVPATARATDYCMLFHVRASLPACKATTIELLSAAKACRLGICITVSEYSWSACNAIAHSWMARDAKACGALQVARTGDIIAVGGLKDVTTGETLCDDKAPILLERMDFPDPVIKVSCPSAAAYTFPIFCIPALACVANWLQAPDIQAGITFLSLFV